LAEIVGNADGPGFSNLGFREDWVIEVDERSLSTVDR
jgi:hypothetical protein